MSKYPQNWLDNVHVSTISATAHHDMLGVIEAALRLRAQRDRAWLTLSHIEDALGKLDESGIAFLLAGASTERDIDDWNALLEATGGKLENIKELPA